MKKLKSFIITSVVLFLIFWLGCLYFGQTPAEALQNAGYLMALSAVFLIFLFFIKMTFKILGLILLLVLAVLSLHYFGVISLF